MTDTTEAEDNEAREFVRQLHGTPEPSKENETDKQFLNRLFTNPTENQE